MSLTAELIEDGGEAASSPDDFFRAPRFLGAEGVTHSVVVDDLALPVVVSDIPGSDRRDAASPYGFPGGTTAPGIDPIEVDWSPTGLVSLFVRDRAGAENAFAGGTVRSVQIADPELPRKSRMSDRQQVRRNERDGWTTEVVAGAEVTGEQREGFERAYRETMQRTQATERYFFSSEYFEAALDGPGTWLVLAREPGGETGAGSLAVASDGFLHYYLSGTANDHLRASPMKNIIEAMIGLATDLKLPLNLGGGATPGDSLEEFKRGFANREAPFHTHGIVCDEEAYAALAAGKDAGEFFPRYRAPA
jgi:hypothetical protein